MIHITAQELGELRSSLVSLEAVLETLDRIGAGIAAIHVDAAIDQLRNNLEVVDEQGSLGRVDLPPRAPVGSFCEQIHPLE